MKKENGHKVEIKFKNGRQGRARHSDGVKSILGTSLPSLVHFTPWRVESAAIASCNAQKKVTYLFTIPAVGAETGIELKGKKYNQVEHSYI